LRDLIRVSISITCAGFLLLGVVDFLGIFGI
jgi:hypothetical protein